MGLNWLTLAEIIGCVWLTLREPRLRLSATGLHSSTPAHGKWDCCALVIKSATNAYVVHQGSKVGHFKIKRLGEQAGEAAVPPYPDRRAAELPSGRDLRNALHDVGVMPCSRHL